jgi:hypothetical protein
MECLCGFSFARSAAIWGQVSPVNDIPWRIQRRFARSGRRECLRHYRGIKMSSLTSMRDLTPFRAVVIVAVLLLVAHAPLFMNDSIFMDDWLLLKVLPNYVVDLDFLLNGAGHPVFFGYIGLANLTGAPVLSMKVLALLGVFFGGACLLLAAIRVDLLTPTEAVGFSLIVWIYPGYQMWAGKANAVYVFSFGLFFVGIWLLTLAFSAKAVSRVVLRVAAALVFFLSFALNSIMVLYAFAMLGLFVAVWRDSDQTRGPVRRLLLAAWRCLLGYPEFVVLPLVYWGALNIWFRRVGIYAGHYNVHLPTAPELLDGWHSFFRFGYVEVLKSAIRALQDNRPLLVVAAIPVVIALVLFFRKAQRSRASVVRLALPLLLSLLLFFLLALPYLVAGLIPGENFYESRHLLLFGLPLALGLLAVERAIGFMVGDRAATVGVFGVASILSIAVLWNGYVFLQARALKQEALSSQLAGISRPAATVFNLDDGFMDYPARHLAFGVPEITGMLRLAWGDRPFLGFTLRAERPTILQEMEENRTSEGSAYHHIDPSGPQGTISLQPGPAAASNFALTRHYYACRLLARCDVSAFLMQLASVKIELGPIAGLTPLDASK